MNDRCIAEMSACVADASCERAAVDAIGDPTTIDPPGMNPLTGALRERVAQNELAICLGAANVTIEGCGSECGFDGKNFSCVDDFGWPQPDAAAARVEFSAPLAIGVPVQSFEPLPGVQLQVCANAGSPCALIDTWTTDVTGHATGTIPLTPNSGFRGHLRLSDGSSGQTLYPSHVLFGAPLAGDLRGGTALFTRASVKALAEISTGNDVVEGRAVVLLVFLDCANNFAPGIQAKLPTLAVEGATVEYFPGDGATGGGGLATIWNAKPGCYDVGGSRDGQETHRMRIFVEPNTGTLAYVNPRSDPFDPIHSCTPDFEL